MENLDQIDVSEVTDAFHANKFDPNGSYTGVPLHGGNPVQDADDL